MIDPVVIQRIREEVSLLELAKEHGVVFRRQGADWFALCPFHAEKGGSFKVNEKANKYKCFGCGAGGDVIGFYLAINGLDARSKFPEALRVLGARIGLTVDGKEGKPAKKKQVRRTREQIEADKYLRAKAASAAGSRGLRITKLVPPSDD